VYYRVAIKTDSSSPWQWKSSVLSELSALFQWLRLYRALPHDRLRIFSCISHEGMNEQLMQENQGLASTSATATQFLQERLIASPETSQKESVHGTKVNKQMGFFSIATEPSTDAGSREIQALYEKGINVLEKRRRELEYGAGGDHNLPYQFTLPTIMPQAIAWVKLLARVHNGDILL
jgi:hypothetical protein